MINIPLYRDEIKKKREKFAEIDSKKRRYRILLTNLPFVIGEDPRFPNELSVNKHIESVYQEEFGERKTIAQIKAWLGTRADTW